MNKNDLVKKIADNTGLTQDVVKEVIDSAVNATISALSRGEKVTIADFGTLSIVEKEARRFYNPHTSKNEIAPAHVDVKFSAATFLKEIIQ